VKLHASVASGIHLISAYGEGYVAVNGARHERNLVVLPDRILPWEAAGFEALRAEDFAPLAALAIEVLLLGTGATLRFPPPQVTRAVHEARIGLEVMDVRAACRTYNILAAEGRRVAAALLLR
jgi:uncharacterized protein